MKIYVPIFRPKYQFGNPLRHGIQEIDTEDVIYYYKDKTYELGLLLYHGTIYDAEYIYSSEKGVIKYWENCPFIDRIMYDRKRKEFVPYDFKRAH